MMNGSELLKWLAITMALPEWDCRTNVSATKSRYIKAHHALADTVDPPEWVQNSDKHGNFAENMAQQVDALHATQEQECEGEQNSLIKIAKLSTRR